MNVGTLATNIWDTEFGDATGDRTARISSISGWLQVNVGQLNNYIYTSFSGEANGTIVPETAFGLEEENIYTENNFSTWLYEFPFWLTVNENTGVLSGGDDMELIFTANSNNLPIGNYSSLFWLSTNDYNNQLLDIVVNLEVTGEIEPCSGWTKGDINSDGTLDSKDTYKYDNNGNVLEKNKYK